MNADVAVVGGGMAGACAALAASKAGARVIEISRAPGATAVSSGAIDFAATSSGESLRAGAERLALRPGHPYSLLGKDLGAALDGALLLLRHSLSSLGLAGARTGADGNLWLASPLGRQKAAALAQGPIAAGDLHALPAGARLGVAALCGGQAIEARLIASGLHQSLSPASSAVALDLDFYPAAADAQRQLAEIAADLDRPGRRSAFGEALSRAAKRAGATHILVPTVGLANPVAAQAELGSAAGLPVFELLGAPPSVPGLRLQRALEAALEAAGVIRVRGIAERSLSAQLQIIRGGECEQVSCKAVVLASGRFLGGGIRCAPDGTLGDSALGLPAWAGARRRIVSLMNEELAGQRAGDRHLALEAGLRADSRLRALDEDGRPATANGAPVFAAGAALGGYDPARGDGGLGVAALTGRLAGLFAAEAAR